MDLTTDKLEGATVKKQVHIISDDPIEPEFALTVTGAVLPIVAVDTPMKRIQMAGLAGSELRTEVTLKKGSWLGVELLSHELKWGNARVEGVKPVEGEDAWVFTLAAPPAERPGVFNEELRLKVRTSDGEERDLPFVFRVEHNARVLASPRGQIKFPAQLVQKVYGPNPTPQAMTVNLRAGGDEVNFNVLDVKLDENLSGVFRTELVERSAGKMYQVKVWLDSWHEKRQVIGKMTILTDDPEAEEVSLWVMALFNPPQASN